MEQESKQSLQTQIYERIIQAQARIDNKLYVTPLMQSIWLEQIDGQKGSGKVLCKLESEQMTGSFKARGALNYILSVDIDQPVTFVTSSTGNHALGTINAIEILTRMKPEKGSLIKALIYAPTIISSSKLKKIQQKIANLPNIQLVLYGTDCIQSEYEAIRYAKENNFLYFSAYAHIDVAAGQGTIGYEIMNQIKQYNLQEIDAVFVPTGGGGLITGIGAYIKSKSPNTKMIGCLPLNNACMSRSVAQGKILEEGNFEENGGSTLSEATAGGIEDGSITFDYCKQYIDEWIEVTEQEIEKAIVGFVRNHNKIIEGAPGVSIASYIKVREQYKDKNVVLLICGSNMKIDVLTQLLNKYQN